MNRHFRNSRLSAFLLMGLCMSAAGTGSTENPAGTSAPTDTAAADAAKAQAEQAKADKKAAADKAKADKKAADDKAKAEKKEADAKAKADAKAAGEQAKADKAAKAEQEKADKKAKAEADKKAKADAAEAAKKAKEAAKQPEQNGVRRPKADSLCGKAWAIMDELTLARGGSAVPIAALLVRTTADGLNEGNVRAEYARWRKFNGVTGRIVDAKPEAPAAGDTSGAQAAA